MKRLLLHICCGPCAPYVVKLLTERFQVTGYFDNPNIQPQTEYHFRRLELVKAAQRCGWTVIYPQYDPQNWLAAMKGLEDEPERGRRCPVCFEFRLRRSCVHARDHGFDCVATTLSVSPYKNSAQINAAGSRLALEYGVEFLAEDFKKQNGFQIGRQMARALQIQHQHYCGCEYSRPSGENSD